MAFRVRDLFRTRRQAPPRGAVGLQEANSLIRDGRLDQAAAVLRELLAADPDNSEAWYKQGNVFKGLDRPADALASYQRAIDLTPNYTAAHCNRSVVLLALGRAQEALRGLERAIEIDPHDAIAHYNLGVTAQALGRMDAALAAYDNAIGLNPHYAEAHFSRGNALARLERWEEALASYDRALLLEPHNVAAHLHRGNVLRALQRWDEALESYDRAIALTPDQADGHFNRGVLLEQLKRFPAALASFDRAVAINPQFAPAQYNRALLLLASGDFVGGLMNYEWRWKNRDTSFDPATHHGSAPLWSGRELLENKSILVFSEQGLGDTLQFCRYIKLLAERGATVIFEVQPPLAGLLAHVAGASAVIARGDVVPRCDYKCALLSLPLAFDTRVETIPAQPKYLRVEAARTARWQHRLGPRTRPRIGLVWSGNAQMPNDHQRSMPLSTLVAHLPRRYDYFCLQKDIRAQDRATLDANPFIVDHAPDFMDTAALCECMDIVVSVCTSVAHLAGALGRPLWILLAYNADWRWLEERADSPWYPSARLYRQKTIGDWAGVAARVGEDLRRTFALPAGHDNGHPPFERE